jgi:hypothetical protein
MTGGYGCGNLLFTVRLACHDTDANQFREEGRHFYLDRRGCLHGRRDGLRTLTMRRLLEPWTTQDDERLKTFASQGASIIRASAALKRKIAGVRTRARALGCAFPPLRLARKKWADTPDDIDPRNNVKPFAAGGRMVSRRPCE